MGQELVLAGGDQLKGCGGWVLGEEGWPWSSRRTSRHRALAPGPQPHPRLETKIGAFTIAPPLELLWLYNKDTQDKELQLFLSPHPMPLLEPKQSWRLGGKLNPAASHCRQP